MTIKKRDMVFAAIGASISELVHKITGKTPFKNSSDKISKKKKDEIISRLLNEAGDLSSEEQKAIKEAMNFDPVFRIVTRIDNPEDLIDKDLKANAELRLKEIEKKDKKTYLSITQMQVAHSFGMRRINRLNKFLLENTVDDIIRINNQLVKSYPDRSTHYEEWLKAFNFEATEEDEIENIAYGVEKLLSRASVKISVTQTTIMFKLKETYGIKIFNTYLNFVSYMQKSSPAEHQKFLNMMHEKYTASPQNTLDLIKKAMKIKSNSARKKYFDIA